MHIIAQDEHTYMSRTQGDCPMVHMCRVMFGRWKVKLAHHDETSIEISMEAAYVSPVIDLVSVCRLCNQLDDVVMSEYDG